MASPTRKNANPFGMNDMQYKFAQEYRLDRNAKQAAIRAGYSIGCAEQTGCILLTNRKVSAYIAQKDAEDSRRLNISRERVLDELAKVAFANIDDVINATDASVKPGSDRHDLAAICSIKVKRTDNESGYSIEREVRMHDKLKALKGLVDHLGLAVPQPDTTITVNLIDDIPRSAPVVLPAAPDIRDEPAPGSYFESQDDA